MYLSTVEGWNVRVPSLTSGCNLMSSLDTADIEENKIFKLFYASIIDHKDFSLQQLRHGIGFMGIKGPTTLSEITSMLKTCLFS